MLQETTNVFRKPLFKGLMTGVILLILVLIWFSWNQPVFLWLHHSLRIIGQDGLWELLTFCGDAGVAPLVLVWFIARRPDLVWAALWASLLAYLVSHGLKPLVNEMRPPAVFPNLDVLGPHLKFGSFPSGHTTTIFTLVGLMTLGLPTRGLGTILWWAVGVLVGLSRIAVGVHWPIDVLAGMLIGWTSAAVGLWWAQCTRSKQSKFYWLALLLLILLIALNAFGKPYGLDRLWVVQKVLAAGALVLWLKETRQWYIDQRGIK